MTDSFCPRKENISMGSSVRKTQKTGNHFCDKKLIHEYNANKP